MWRMLRSEPALAERLCRNTADTPAALRGVVAASNSASRLACIHPVPMRAAPTVTMTAALPVFDGSSVTTIASLNANYSTATLLETDATTTAATLTVGRALVVYQSTSGNVNVSARL